MSYFAPYIDAAGLHMPTYEDRRSDLVTAYRSIFGVSAGLSAALCVCEGPGRYVRPGAAGV